MTKETQARAYWHLAHVLALRQAGIATIEVHIGGSMYQVCGCNLCVDYMKDILRERLRRIRSDRDPTIVASDRPTSDRDSFPPTAR